MTTKNYLAPIPDDWSAQIAFGSGKAAATGWKNKAITLEYLTTGLSHHAIGPKDGPSFLQGSCVDGSRQARAMENLSIIGVDVDNGMPSDEIDHIIAEKGLWCIRYTTHSHGKAFTEVGKDAWVKYSEANSGSTITDYLIEKKRYLPEIAADAKIENDYMTAFGLQLKVAHPPMDKNRLIFILAQPWNIRDYKTQTDAIKVWKDAYLSFAHWLGIEVDSSCTDPSRLFYLPRRDKGAPYEAKIHDGDAIDIFALPAAPTVNARSSKMTSNVFLQNSVDMGAREDAKIKGWAAKKAHRFQIVQALQESEECGDIWRPERDKNDKYHIECPFEEEHTAFGGTGTFIINAGESSGGGFVVHCTHNSCADRDRLDFLQGMLDKCWLTWEDLENENYLIEVEDDEEVEEEEETERAPPEPVADFSETVIAAVVDIETADAFIRRLAENNMTELGVMPYLEGIAAKLNRQVIVKSVEQKDKDPRKYIEENEVTVKFLQKVFREFVRLVKAERVEEARKRKEKEKKRAEKGKDQKRSHHNASNKTIIDIHNEDYDDAYPLALEALVKMNNSGESPYIFRANGALVRVYRDENDIPRANVMGVSELTYELSLCTKIRQESGTRLKAISAPRDISTAILAHPSPPFPPLNGIVTSPIFGPDGKIRTKPGYDRSTRLYYDPPDGFVLPTVPMKPSKTDVDEALELIMGNALVDFPFDGPESGVSERAHALCMVLLPFVRQMINGPTPIHLIVKPTPGTGASRLVNIYSLISAGEEAIPQTETKSEDEMRKRITSVLMAGKTTFYLDNVNYKVDSSSLASALTSQMWEDRVLGESRVVSVPNKLTWIICGNNPKMSNEMTRRCARIRLDAKVERPEERTGFKHENLEEWVRDNRERLVWACLVLIQNWIAQGKPQGQKTKGSFESWARTMGGILQCAGVPGFLGNEAELREGSDEEGAATKQFILAWWETHFDAEAITGGHEGLFNLIQDHDIPVALQGASEHARACSFGRFVSSLEGRIFDVDGEKVRVERTGAKKNKQMWKLTRL